MLLQLSRIQDARTARCSSWDQSGRNWDAWNIPAGRSVVLADIKGPGRITHIWMTQGNHYRECLLRITWDNARHPSVLCPLGDFFGLGHGIVNSYQSLLFSASTSCNNRFNQGCALNCYVPMPFRKRALVELVNESGKTHGQYFYVDYENCAAGDLRGAGYFHAEFRRTNPFGGWAPELLSNTPPVNVVNKERTAWRNNYVILEAKGRGHYLGCNLSVSNFQGTWWGEGDDMIWVDGYKWPPDLHGTGSEDYLNQAWGMQPNAFLRNGSSIHEANTGGYQTSYVHHLENPVRFKREIKVTIEHGHGNHLGNEMSSVAYWYAEKPTPTAVPPPVAQRMPVEKKKGRWVFDRRNQCPGKPVAMTKEMKENKRTAPRLMAAHQAALEYLEACRWRSKFFTTWHVSELRPPKPLKSVKAVHLSDRMGWKRYELATGSKWFTDVHGLYGFENGVIYLANRFRVARSNTWIINLGHDGGAKLFVDGKAVLCEPKLINPALPTRSRARVTLCRGVHEICIALDTANGSGWGIAFSFEIPRGARRAGAKSRLPECL